MEDKWKEKFGDDGFPKNSAEFVEWTKVENSIKLKDNVSDAILNELHDKLFAYKEKKKKVEKRKSEHNNARDHKATAPTISEYFAVSVWRMSLLEVKKPEKTEDEKVEEQANHSHHHRHSHALNIVKVRCARGKGKHLRCTRSDAQNTMICRFLANIVLPAASPTLTARRACA